MIKHFTSYLTFFVFFAIACKKETETITSAAITDYYPLEIGKYITYDLDSTVFYLKFNQESSIVHYQVQDRVAGQISDNLGRAGYRVLRYIRKDSTQQWEASNTFMVVPTDNSLEFIENNLRFIKLQLPIKQDFYWKGNSYIDTYSDTADLRFLDDWDYTYDSVNTPLTINSVTIDNTIKILERDEFLGQDPSIPGTNVAFKDYSVEKYGKGIGLVYREFLHWEYQGKMSLFPGYTGYGVTMKIIDHN